MTKSNEGEWLEEPEQNQILFKGWYQKLFSIDVAVDGWRQTKITFPTLEPQLVDSLSKELRDEEIK